MRLTPTSSVQPTISPTEASHALEASQCLGIRELLPALAIRSLKGGITMKPQGPGKR
jgi:hypothetical protein